MIIYHNPRCRKSRETLEIIRSKGVEPFWTEYLKEPLSVDQLKEIIEKLGINPSQLLRKGEAIYKEEFKGKELSEEEWIYAMAEYPELMERPVVMKGKKAILGRPPENVNELL
ncbi:MAG TPA: arsenate reductase (glutaredoxin) [Flavobacteriales bacterium]|nr:arsenate reductase (glutaredoxin) [Flavobacteriales bacterium]